MADDNDVNDYGTAEEGEHVNAPVDNDVSSQAEGDNESPDGGSGSEEGTAPTPYDVQVELESGQSVEVENVVDFEYTGGELTLLRPTTGEFPDAWYNNVAGFNPIGASDADFDEDEEQEHGRGDTGPNGSPPPWPGRGRRGGR